MDKPSDTKYYLLNDTSPIFSISLNEDELNHIDNTHSDSDGIIYNIEYDIQNTYDSTNSHPMNDENNQNNYLLTKNRTNEEVNNLTEDMTQLNIGSKPKH